MKISIVTLFVSLLFLAGCLNTADKYYGSGPLTLSPKALATFNHYLTVGEPIAFAITTDGRNPYYWYCKDVQCTPDNGPRQAVDGCEERYGKPCGLYAHGKIIVWKFDSPTQSRVQQTRTEPRSTAPVPEPQSQTSDSISLYNDCMKKFTSEIATTRHQKCTCFSQKVMEEFSDSSRTKIINAISGGRNWSIGDDDNDKVKACFG